jgi:UDP-N-acetylmuramoylalanine--D-glutamate ligase
LKLRTEHGEDDLLGVEELPVPGNHNVSNALTAAVACRLAGCDGEAIARGLRAYRPLPHRLELVADVNGVRFYNDSKATNPASAACALTAFPAGTIHLVLGGRDKGADWGALAELIRTHVRRVFLVGEAAPKLKRLLAGSVPVRVSATVPQAVVDAFDGAATGDVVLLAPGCASFDQYQNFAERGDDFRRAARSLGESGGSDG